jgi:glucose/mannose-6-phosphate isomerase
VSDLGPAKVAELDASDMLGAIAGLSGQLREGYADAHRQLAAVQLGDGGVGATPALPARPAGVAVLGMGGSAIGADLVLAACPDLAVPATVARGYELPGWVAPETLVVAVSYSGETEETLAATTAAVERGCVPLCVTSGGSLAALAAERGLPVLAVPSGMQPRAALGHLSMPLLATLERARLTAAAGDGVAEAAGLVADAAATCAPGVGDELNPAKALARRLHGRVPVVYGEGPTATVARRWKTQLNENAKAAAFYAELPELDHNEIEGWAAGGALGPLSHVVLLQDHLAGARSRRRAALTVDEIAAQGVPVSRLETRGSSLLARVFSLVSLGDHLSFYLALLNCVDPTPVEAIQRLKRGLADEPIAP